MNSGDEANSLNDTILDHCYTEPFDYSNCAYCGHPQYMHAIRRVKPPQEVANAHTLIAQKYAGALIGYEVRAEQQGMGHVYVDESKPWKEPTVYRDDCIFCQRLNDESAEQRVEGYQKAIEREVARGYYLNTINGSHTSYMSAMNEYWNECIANGREPTTPPPDPLPVKITAVQMVDLPLRLKRKMCIEWNHVLLEWMKRENLRYDFGLHEFFSNESPLPIPTTIEVDAEVADGQDTSVCG